MDKKIILFIGLLVAGCVSSTPKGTASIPNAPTTLLNTPIDQIQLGMTYQQLANFIKSSVIVGYQKSPTDPSVFEPLIFKNPLKAEVVKNDDKEYEVFYYLGEMKKADSMITDDELIPVIFQNGYVVGKGWDFLWQIKK